MPDEAYRAEVYKHALTVLEQTTRILRTDGDIVELVHRMVATAEEAVKHNPRLLFERSALTGGLEINEGDIVGGQSVGGLLDQLFKHLEKEKELIAPLLPDILKLIALA